MSDWQKGDLALCIKHGGWKNSLTGRRARSRGMKAGVVASVRHVAMSNSGILTLWFEGWGGENFSDGFAAMRFRKITPGAKIEGIEEPRRVPVPAEQVPA